jgi:hypothetical protein
MGAFGNFEVLTLSSASPAGKLAGLAPPPRRPVRGTPAFVRDIVAFYLLLVSRLGVV